MVFTVFLLFMECWGWTFVAFTAFVVSIRRSGWSFWWRLVCHCDILCSRSALECCQEAAAILERLADTDEDKNHLSLVQDRLAAAYLWQALLEHKAKMEDNL